MVQISKSLALTALALAPAFAAPVIQYADEEYARARFNLESLKKVGKLGSTALGAVGTAATISSMLTQQPPPPAPAQRRGYYETEELEYRSDLADEEFSRDPAFRLPHIDGQKLKKYASLAGDVIGGLGTAATVIGMMKPPPPPPPPQAQTQKRSVHYEDVVKRFFDEELSDLFARDFDEDVYQRELGEAMTFDELD